MLQLKHRLNSSQVAALAASMKQVVTLIQGPPGTGKTTTSVALLELHAKYAKLLGVTAPSNHAVDEVMLRLLTCGLEKSVLRVGPLKKVCKRLRAQHLEHCLSLIHI